MPAGTTVSGGQTKRMYDFELTAETLNKRDTGKEFVGSLKSTITPFIWVVEMI